ncbi:uncharacterized protein LOC134266327 [Saccostrea cucullata]|uniref:uncharacterized protein LOC134266327 n=1 Tax=Saccostrea cuccullata TaxID=36930 RepID=UPI002ED56113
MYIFGLCYFFHCALFAWKHYGSDCPNQKLALTYNIIAMIYTFVLFLYFNFYHDRRSDNSKLQNFFSVGILLANVCIWLDALFSESNDLFQYSHVFVDTNDTEIIMFNITNSSIICSYSARAMRAIEKTEPFFSPAIIEFSLMAIDLLFLKTEIPPEQDDYEVEEYCILFRKCFQALFSLTSFALFALTFTFVIIQDKLVDMSNFPDDFTVYVAIQISFKFIMLVLILICISVVWTNMKYHFNVWCLVLLISCFGNVVNHMIYCFGLTVNKGQIEIPTYDLTMSWIDNIISIILAFCQTNYLLGTHSHIEYNESCCCREKCSNFYKMCVNYFCFLIGILNLGLWIGDSIGEERIPVLSYPMYQAYDSKVWNVIIKLVLPLTIFFRFNTGLSFLEMYWERDKVIRIERE